MTALDLARLREVAEPATPGPWRLRDAGIHAADGIVLAPGPMLPGSTMGSIEGENFGHDLRFILACNPSTVLALLDRLAAAEATVDRVAALADAWAAQGATTYAGELDEAIGDQP